MSGLVVPHAVRRLFCEDVRLVLPTSLLLVAADTLAPTAFGANELPVGAVTAILGGPIFLILLTWKKRYSAL